MRSEKSVITGLGILVLALGLAVSAQAGLSDGSIYNESFTGGTFDDSQSALAWEVGGGDATISAAQEALELNNTPSDDGWLEVTLDAPVPGGTEIVMEAVVSVTQGAEISHHAYILNPKRWDQEAMGLAIKGYEVDFTHWDLDIWTTNLAAGSFRAGLTLSKSLPGEVIYYTVSQRILAGNLEAEVYVDEVYIGTYPCILPGSAHELTNLRVGHGSASYGFYNAYFSDVRIAPTGGTGPSLNLSNNSIFYETFDDDTFSEPTSSFVGDPVVDPNGIRFDNNAMKLVALAGHSSEYNTGTIPDMVGANGEYVVEVKVHISSAVVFFPNAFLMDPWNTFESGHPSGGIDLKLEAIDNEDPNGTWDVEIEDLNTVSNAGLLLTKDQYHYIAQHHLGNDANDIDLYVDGSYVGSYPDRDKTYDLHYVRLGNVSSGLGFGTAWFDSVSVGGLVGPPVCGDPGTVYLPSDLNEDCKVDLPDFALFSGEWLHCTDPGDPNCDQYY